MYISSRQRRRELEVGEDEDETRRRSSKTTPRRCVLRTVEEEVRLRRKWLPAAAEHIWSVRWRREWRRLKSARLEE